MMCRMEPRKLIAVAAAAAALALAGCDGSDGPPSADDPRDGRVTITWSDCAFGSCIYDWKVCVGPDLITHLDARVDGDDDGLDVWTRGSDECTPRTTS